MAALLIFPAPVVAAEVEEITFSSEVIESHALLDELFARLLLDINEATLELAGEPAGEALPTLSAKPFVKEAVSDPAPVLPPDAPEWAFGALAEWKKSPRLPATLPAPAAVNTVNSLQSASTSPAFEVTSVQLLPDQTAQLTWTSQPGRRYRIDSSLDLETWFVATPEIVSQGATSIARDEGISYEWPKTPPPLAGNPPRIFWRVVELGSFDSTGLGLAVATSTPQPWQGDATVTVTATSGAEDILNVTLYVDGRTVGKARELPATFVFNTSELPNGPHRVHAVAEATSPVFTGSGLPTVRRAAVSPPLEVTSENFVSAWYFSQGPFYPQLGEIQRTTARFQEATDWRLYIFNSAGFIVRETAGTGAALDYTWDGRDSDGVTVPFDAYYYFIDFPPFLAGLSAPGPEGAALIARNDSLVGRSLPQELYQARVAHTALRLHAPASAHAPVAKAGDGAVAATPAPFEPNPAPSMHNRFWVGWYATSQAHVLDDYAGSGLENFDGSMLAEANNFNDLLRQLGWLTVETRADARYSLAEAIGPTYGGVGPLRSADLGLIGGHGEYRPSGLRFGLPAPFGVLKHWNKAEGTMTDVPIPVMELGDDVAPASLRWAALLLCDVMHPSAVANGRNRNNLIGPRMRGLVGSATKFAIGGSAVAREWAIQMHMTTGGMPANPLTESWYEAGIVSQSKQRVSEFLRDEGIEKVTFRAVYRNNARTDNVLTMFSAGQPGEFIEADDPVDVWTR